MFELIELHARPEVPEVEYRRLLGYPRRHVLEGRARELADEARAWFSAHGRPWIFGREFAARPTVGERVEIGGQEFRSPRLAETFNAAGAHGAVVVAVSAGPECEETARRHWQEARPDEYFFLEMFGSAVVEQLITQASGRICAWAGERQLAVLPHFSPGYSGWNIADQVKLGLLLTAAAALPGPLEVLESGMLRPKKSLLAVFGLTKNAAEAGRFARLIPCETCSLPGCQYRRAAYRRASAQFEEIGSLA
jgi:hypothetical protein